VRQLLIGVYPEMPYQIADRDADVWEPLLAVADAIGRDWPERARVAAVALVAESKESTPSLGIRLLADLRTVFGDSDVLTSESIVKALNGLSEAPWGDLYGKLLTKRGLAQRLRRYEVTSTNVRAGDSVVKGYKREDLWDSWQRYLTPPQETATSATSATSADASLPDEAVEACEVCGLEPEHGDEHFTSDGRFVCGAHR
jgi:hypothetical protein